MPPVYSRVTRRRVLATVGTVGSTLLAGCLDDAGPENGDDTTTPGISVDTVADGFYHPWAITIVPPDGELLVTERGGDLWLVDTDGSKSSVSGVPSVHAQGQGGLLDIALHPEYESDQWVYLTYSATDDGYGSATHLARGRFDRADLALTDLEVLYVVEPFQGSTQHYGSRVTFGDDGLLYMTSGDRGSKDFSPSHPSQDRSNAIGSTLRLTPSGEVPEDNPFVDEAGALDELFSYGHRNAQGLTVHPETGDLWLSEHGERDGDAIHVLEAGGNYGWPVAHTGCEYASSDPVGDDPFERDDVVDPVYHWECDTGGFPPAGMTFYSGDAFPQWTGDLFVGNLAGQYLGRFTVDGYEVAETEALLDDRDWRIRDVEEDPETGHLYVAVDDAEAPIVELAPEQA